MRKVNCIYFIVLCTIIISCSTDSNLGTEYIPFQESEKGQWGMISPEGEILFSEEFKNTPTIAKEGRFMVKNNDGLWEIYTSEAKPKKIGGEYLYATCFDNGKALVAERNGYVMIINKDGKEIKTLDKIGNNVVDAVEAFSEGYAVYRTGDYFGAIDDEGKEIIKPEYVVLCQCHDGKFIGINRKYEQEFEKHNGKYSYEVIDTKGKILFDLSKNKYSNVGTKFVDGLLKVSIKQDDDDCWGLINDKNEVVVKPTAKFKEILDIKGGKFIYSNGDGVGLMDINGESLIRAKYEHLVFESTNRLFAVTEKSVNENDYKCRLIDEKDNRIGDEEFSFFYSSANIDGKHAFVKVSDKLWSIIDEDGSQIEKLPDIVNISVSIGDNEVKNDHIDFSSLFSELGLSIHGVDGMTLHKTRTKEAIKRLEMYSSWEGNSEHPVSDPYWYDHSKTLTYEKEFNQVKVEIGMVFPSEISRAVYRKEYEDYGYYSYSYDVLSGYVFNDLVVKTFAVKFSCSGKLAGKEKLLLNALNEHIRKQGGILEKSNINAFAYTINKDERALFYKIEDYVTLMWGDLPPIEQIDLNQYDEYNESVPETDTVTVDSIAYDDYYE